MNPPRRPGPGPRRGLVVGAIAAAMGLVAHLGAGGGLPLPVGLALALGVSLLIGVLLNDRQRGAARDAVLVLTAQGAQHALFTIFTPAAGGGSGALRTSGHHAPPVVPPLTAPGEPVGEHVHSSMWLAHLGAALATAFVIARGDQMLTRIARVGRTLVRRYGMRILAGVAIPRLPRGSTRPQASTGAWAVLPLGVDRGVRRRRGPPRRTHALA